MHDNDEVSKRSKSRMVNKKLPISSKLFINAGLWTLIAVNKVAIFYVEISFFIT